MDTNVTTPQAVATVIAVEGQAFARDPSGQMRPLKAGDVLLEGDTIVTLAGGQVQLAFLDGHVLSLLPNETFTFSAETAPTTRPGIDEASLPAGEADRIIQALERGENIDDQIEAPGAGLAGGSNNLGNNFVRLLRIVEPLTPLEFQFGNIANRFEFPEIERGANPLLADNVPGAPTVAVPDENGAASGDKTVVESDGPIPGSFTITAPAGLQTLTVGGTPITETALGAATPGSPIVINTGEGTLSITGFNPTTGVVSYTYDPNPQNNPGDVTDVVAIQVTDDNGIVSAINNLDIVIQDTAPLANADAASIAEDATPNTVSGNVRTNDVNNVDTPITITAGTGTSAGTYGSLTLNADGSYTYTLDNANPAVNALNNGDTLTEVFSYSVTDADGDVSTASLTVTINGTNDGAPTVAVPDENGAASGDKTVVESDGPIPGSFTITAPAGLQTLTVGGTPITETALGAATPGSPIVINTGEGTLSITGFNPTTGVVSYTYDPNPQNNPGDVTDVIAIQVTDDNGIVSAINNLDIVIQDTAPLANADAASIAEDATPNTVSGNVRTNDVNNVDTPITITAGTGTSAGTYGSLTLNADGSYTYTLDNANPAVNALNNGDTLTEVFSYSVTDADGDVSTASLTVTINGTNDGAPTVAVPDENGAASGDKTVVESDGPIPGSFTITAPAGLQTLTVGGTPITETALGAATPGSPIVINTGEGTLSITGFNPTTGVVSYTYDPNPQNNPGDVTDVIAIQVTDDNGIVSAINNLDIVIQDTAPLANADAASIAEDATPNTVSGNVRTNDVNNVDTPITITAGTGTSAGTYGSLTLNADGSYTYTLDNANPAVNALNNGDTLTEVFSYSVTDADGDVSTASLTVTINGTNDGAPTVAVPDENGAASGDKTVVESDGPIPGSFTITAPAGLQTLTVGGTPITETALGAATPGSPIVINTGEGTLSITGFNPTTGVVSYTYDPNPQNNPGDVTDVVAIQVTDDNGIVSAINNLDIVIQDTAPLANADAASIAEDATPNTVSGNVRTNDVNNVDTPITITAGTGTSAGTYGSLTLNADGSYTYTLDNANPAVNALNNGDTLTEVFSYSVTDADGDVSTASLTVTINGTNDGAPTVAVPDENGAASGDKTVVESDGPIPGSFTITAPAGLQTLTVGGTPITETALGAATPGSPIVINTGEGTLSITGFNPTTGVVSYTYDPNPQNNPGDVTDVVAIQVTDDNGIVSAINNLDIVIQDTAPLANADAASIAEDATPNTVSGNVRTNDVNNVDTPITITAGTGTSAGTYGSLTLNADGSYTYTLDNANPAVNALNNGDTLTEVFSYSVTDADGDVSTASLTVTINGTNDGAPTVAVPDENGAASGDKTVVESDGPIPGSFTITAPAGLQTLTVGGTPITETALGAATPGSPIVINTGEGTLSITGFNPTTGVVSYTYDPNPQNNPGDVTDVVAIQVTDDNGIVSAINNLDIVIQDTAPLANADAASIAEDATPNTVSGNVRTNDVNNVDTPITITAGTGTSAGTYGSLTLNADGSYTYTLDNANPAVNALNNGDTLTEVFSYSVTDADGDVSTASLTVTINGTNDGAPTVAVPDENGAASGDKTVVESDGPIPGSFTITAPAGLQTLTVGGTPITETALGAATPGSPIVINTGEGTLSITGFNPTTGVVSYTYDPNPQNNPGDVTDVVAIQVTDDNGIVSAINNLDIVIQDTAPLANADAASIAEDATPNTVSGNVRTNDVNNVDTPITITAGTGTSAGTYGSLTLNADGSYTYTLDNANPAVNALNNGDTLTEVFSYSVTDADGDVSTASLTVTINGTNDGAPTVAVPDENGAASGDKTVVESDGPIPGSFTITAPAGLQTLTVGGTPITETALGAATPGSPIVINTGEGTLSITGFNPTTGVVSYTYDPNPQNNPGDVTDVVAIQVTDDNGIVSAINNLDIVIQDTAPLANADAASIAEDATPNTVSGNVRTNDVNNVDTPITITAGTGTSAGTYGSLTLNADGSYTYTLDNANPAVNALNNGDTLTEVFSYSVTDADGDVSTASLTVTINGSTDGAPTVAVPDENGAASGDKTVVESDGPIPGSFTITAPAGLQTLTVGGTPITETALGAATPGSPIVINTGEGTLSITGFNPTTGVVSYTYDPNPQNNPGDVTDVVAIQVTDDNGIVSAINNLDIVIQDTAPLANADAASIAEDATPNTVSGNVRTNDVNNVDTPITITAGTGTSAGTYGSLTLNADGSYTYTLDNANPAVNALNNGDTLTEVFSYSVTDADGDVSTASLTVTINGSTDGAPTVAVPDENGAASGDKTVVESDGPIPGSFTITAPAGLQTLTVGGTPITETALGAATPGSPIVINTGEGTLSITGFNPTTGVVSYTYDPNPQNNPGDVTDVIAIQVTDDNGIVSAINNLDIVIQDTAPLANADAASIAEDATPNTVSGNVRTNDVNNVDTPITITAGTGTSAGTYGSLTLNADGSYTYTLDNANPAVNALNNGDTLTEVFSYSVTDADGDVSTASLTVTINGTNDGAPTVAVPDENGAASGDKTVVESDGPIPGSFTITAPAGLQTLTVGGTPITETALGAATPGSPIVINTGEGTLSITGFNPTTGVVSYTYDPNPQNNPGDVTDVVAIQVTDDNGIVSAINNLDIVIQDTAPLANADAASIAEDATPNTVSGNVRTNDVNNVDTPITITAGTGTSAGTYGSLTLNADGSYTYTLDNANPAVNALNNGDTLTEVFSYSVTDADGDVSTASLTVTINGTNDGAPTVAVPDENGAASGDKTVVESDGPIPGSFTITAPAGLQTLTVGGTPITETALGAATPGSPIVINTGEGTLSITGFNPTTGVVSYTYDPNPQNNPGDVTDVVAIQVTDDNGIVSAINNLDIVIQDTAPLANADAASIAEDATPNTVSGNVRTNDVNNVDTPITITAGTGTSAGTYGSLTLNADGSYTYTLDNANPAVNALNNGDTLTEVFSYSVTDADGDVSTASLTVTINGTNDGAPTVAVPDENGAASGDKTVVESDGPIPGSFTITAPAGLQTLTVGGTPITETALGAATPGSPIVINTGEGTLSITGFNPTTGVVSYTYDPNPQNNPGDVTDVVAIQVTDDNGIVSAINNLDIVIQDTAPLANADAASIAEDATPNTVSGNVRTNDVNNVDTPITITAGTGTSAGTYGSLTLNADGSYTYTLDNANPAVNALNNGDTLTEVFSYSVTDADGDVSTASLTVTINGTNDGAPTVAVPDENGAASGDKTVVESDGPIPGSFTITAPAGLQTLTVGGTPITETALGAATPGSPIVINTGEGTLSITGFNPTTGVVSYTYDPNPQNNPGDVTDVVAIQVTDDNGIVSAINNLDIVIQDTAPLANADAASIAEDATPNTVSGNVRTNDVNNVDTPITITAGTGTSAGTYGSLTLNADGSYTYTLDNANPAVNALNNGDTLTEVFSYSVTDADGDVSTASLTVTINGTNDGAPTVAVPDENGAASGDKTVVESDGPIPGSFTITAPAGLQTLTVGGTPITETALGAATPGSPIVINTGEGTLSITGFNPTTGVVSYTYDPNPQNNPGDVTDVIAIQVTDDNGIVSAINNLDIVIQDTAPLANADAASIAEDATPNTVSGNVRTNDVNNVDTPITITAGTGTSAGTYGSLTLNADGSYTYTLDNANPAVNALNNGDTLTEVFSYSVTDADGDVSTASLTVTINGTNDGAPTVAVPDENGAASGDKTVVESDGPIPGSFTITAPAGLQTLTVGGTPITETALGAATPGSPIVINTGEGTLSITGFNPTTGVVSYTYDPNPQNNPGDVTDVVAIQVTDDNGIVSAINNLDIVIQDTAPLANADAASIAEDATPNTVSGNVRTNDVNNVDTPITITAGTGTSAGTYGSLTLNADGSYTYTLDNANPAVNALNNGDTLTEVFSYSVTDADGDVSTASLTVTINGTNDGAPTVAVPDENGAASGDKTVVESDGPIPGSFTITAPAGLQTLTVGGTPITETALGAATPGSPIVINTGEGTLSITGFNPTTGVVSYTYDPNPQNNPGDVTDVVAIQVTDDNGIVSAINNLDIVIQDTAPLANADAASIAEDATPNTVSGNVRTNDVNNVDTPITITAGTGTSAGTYGSLTLNADGSYTYTLDNANPAVNALNNGDTLTEVFSYSVTDADGDVSTASLTVTINGTNDGPVIDLDANNSSGTAGANYTTSFTENGAAVAIADADVSVTDVDSTNLTGATITLTNAQAGDVLAAGALPSGITAAIVGNVVTLSGSATLANYQTAIGAITFANSSENPSTVARTVTVVVTDGTNNSNTATSTINVVAVNDPPANTVPDVQSTAEDTSRIFSTANGNAISVADVDNGTLTTTLTATNGVLNALAFAGATISGNGTGTVIISGTAAAINGAMNGLSYLPNGDYSGPAQISVNTTDGAATDVDTINITVTPVADAPTVYAHVASNGMIASGNSLFAANFNSGGVTGWTANALFGNSFAEIPGGNGKTQTETTLFNTVAWAGQTGSNATEQANFASRWATRTNAGESADGSTFAVYNQGGRSGSDDAHGFLQYTGTALTTTEKASTSYVISAQLYADASSAQANGVGFVFGYVDDNNYFLARWENPSPEYAPAGSLFNSYPGQFQELSLVQIVGGVPIDLARAAFAGDDWFTLNISVSNTGIAVTATDNTSSTTASLNYTYGTVAGGAAAAPALNNVGFYSFDNDSAVRFDNLTINSGLYSYTLNTEAYLNDNDRSETLSAITLTGIPAGATLMDGATPITVTGGTATVQVGHAITITSATPLSDAQLNGITASVTATESVGGSTAVDSDTVKVDHIAGTSSDDWLVGTAGNNTISGGNGNDVLIGGAGTDTLDGGLGADVLRWRLGETGTDTVNNFGTVAGTDVLDLRDLLVGEQHGNNDAGNLASYLHFTFGGGNTTVSVNANATGGVEQTIVLQGVDLVGGFTSDQQIIQSLLNNNKLIVD